MRIQTAVLRQTAARLRIGLLSDTHNLLRPEVEAFLQGCDHIIHAGDICEPGVLARLECIAPLTAVRGNNDMAPWTATLRETELVRMGGINIYVIHNVAELDLARLPNDILAVVFGHSHKPMAEVRNGILYINPGSAGPRRFKLPIAAAELVIENGNLSVRHHYFPR